MRFIESWSYTCANYITTQIGENHEKRRVYYYSFQVILGELFKVAIIFAISFLLGFLKPVATCLATFVFIRTAAGGYHMNTHSKCVIFSLLIFIVSGAVLQYTYSYWEFIWIITFIIISGIFSFIVLIKRAPADTPNKPITRIDKIQKLKRRSIIYLIICLAFAVVLAFKGSNMYALAIIFGLLFEVLTVTSSGYRFFDWISGKIK